MDTKAQAADNQASNLERLQSHLKKGSLAAKLVAARMIADERDVQVRLRQVVLDRLDELRRGHDPDADQ